MRRNLGKVALVSSVLFSALNLQADIDPPITYTEQVTASGTLGGTAFTNALITLTMVGDTSNVTSSAGIFSNAVGTFTVNVSSIGAATFTDSMKVFDNTSTDFVGFEDTTVPADVLDTFNSVFGSYNLMTSIGPISGSPAINPGSTFKTSLGGLDITSTTGNSTFSASTASVPEPASFALLGTALLSLCFVRHKLARR